MTTFAQSHASRIETALSRNDAARSAIAASWARSARLHGLDPSRRPPRDRLTAGELARTQERLGAVLSTAAPHLDRLFQMVGGLGTCVVLADAHGIAVDRRGNSGEDRDFESCGLWTGTDWSEAEAGTNGIGTCLFEGRAVTIHGDQHFLASNTALSCSSVPIHDAEAALVAVLDVSTARPDLPEPVLGLIGHTVAEAARRIEADLFRDRFPKARLVVVPGGERMAGALLAVDADGLVIGATRAARQHLGLSGDLARNPLPVADLLGLEDHRRPEDGERAVLARALARAGGNVSAAARALGLSRATLHRKLGRTE